MGLVLGEYTKTPTTAKYKYKIHSFQQICINNFWTPQY